jgi:membrane associated rhomboid family serine protease
VNWLIIAGAIAVFIWQTISIQERKAQLPAMEKKYADVSVEDMAKELGVKDYQLAAIKKKGEEVGKEVDKFNKSFDESFPSRNRNNNNEDLREKFKERFIRNAMLQQYYVWGAISPFILDGFNLKGLFGHMWLHGGVLHLLGNMLFLWIFGNAICAKIGNIRYMLAYIVLGLIAGISHLIFAGGSVLGASGAINGIVGMFLVLFPQNEITCYWFFFPYIRQFNLSSAWMILLWLVFDIWGAMSGGGSVAYFAHLGGFAGGVVLAILMLKLKMLTTERYEKTLLQIIDEYLHPPKVEEPQAGYYGYLNAGTNLQEELPLVPIAPVPFEPKSISFDPVEQPQMMPFEPQKPQDEFIRFACACGKRVKMPAKYAGKTGKCPQCSARLKIPEK